MQIEYKVQLNYRCYLRMSFIVVIFVIRNHYLYILRYEFRREKL